MKFVLGTKERMTQVFDETGRAWAGTVLRVAPQVVTQIKTVEKDGYHSAQVASGVQKEERVAKAQRIAFGGAFKHVREMEISGDLEKGAQFDVSVFVPGDTIMVTAISKGKGFQGVVKRHGFAGGRRTHGQKHSEREPGSIGGGGRAGGRVAKGMRMAGRMGGDTITVKNLKVLQVNAAENLLLVSGAVPGRAGTLVEVRSI
ncbi:50S ribosomal protein L3 [Patescibacteria group bacterium]|nr:50S ribosomal protein L3 [Patescibacteria group bacterium]